MDQISAATWQEDTYLVFVEAERVVLQLQPLHFPDPASESPVLFHADAAGPDDAAAIVISSHHRE